MINDIITSSISFNQLPEGARTLFTMYVIASLAVVGYTDIPEGQQLRELASSVFDDLSLSQESLADPFTLGDLLDDYFRQNSTVN